MMSDQFIRDLLDQARDEFDLILFDTGPVPGSVEALLVTSQVDGVVIVIPHGETGQALDRMMSYLKVVSANIIGTVFNQAPKPGQSNGAAAGQSASPASTNAPDPQGQDLHESSDASEDIGRDIDEAFDDIPLGSGILAAAVFADDNSGFESAGWELKETSDFGNDDDDASAPGQPGSTRRARDEVSDILPPE